MCHVFVSCLLLIGANSQLQRVWRDGEEGTRTQVVQSSAQRDCSHTKSVSHWLEDEGEGREEERQTEQEVEETREKGRQRQRTHDCESDRGGTIPSKIITEMRIYFSN